MRTRNGLPGTERTRQEYCESESWWQKARGIRYEADSRRRTGVNWRTPRIMQAAAYWMRSSISRVVREEVWKWREPYCSLKQTSEIYREWRVTESEPQPVEETILRRRRSFAHFSLGATQYGRQVRWESKRRQGYEIEKHRKEERKQE